MSVARETVTNSTRIDDLLSIILKKLNLDKVPEIVQFRGSWLDILHKNLIFDVSLLRRIHPEKLKRLSLPLLLQEEFEKIIQTGRNTRPVLSLTNIAFKDNQSTGVHSVHAERAQQQTHRFRLKITERQKELLRQSWKKLFELSSMDGINKFIKNFYPTFFKLNPEGQRLFEGETSERQGRALTNILNWVMGNLDNMSSLATVLAQMGGRHQIYGVEEHEYKAFAKATSETFKLCLGDNVDDDALKAWETCILGISELMIEAGKKVALGFRGEIFREKSNGKWIRNWATLTLDMLYFFADESFTQLKAQYSIKRVERITFPDDSEVDFCFELESTDPPFRLTLCCENAPNFEDWIFEIDWRIQAMQRVFGHHELSSSESDSENQNNRAHQVSKTGKKIEKKKALNVLPKGGAAPPPAVTPETWQMQLSPKQIELIKASWNELLEKKFEVETGGQEMAFTKFFEEFYRRFFTINPSGRRLFGDISLQQQGRALIKMLAMIIKSLDSPDLFINTVYSLGGRHEIYRVEPNDYVTFANTICETLQVILEGSCTTEVKDSWFKIMMELSAMMQSAGKKIKSEV
eukprot:TRINITY_DN1418_c0_g1_i2.p1 TRINITY_DN1418_c0_g1~~TRINITY_DN1418_c0_g1_i2.p1  ORF type:complete len:579 (-),score=119.61 TRINITY_DN1418_c0_g1_i2:706-2442(-)